MKTIFDLKEFLFMKKKKAVTIILVTTILLGGVASGIQLFLNNLENDFPMLSMVLNFLPLIILAGIFRKIVEHIEHN